MITFNLAWLSEEFLVLFWVHLEHVFDLGIQSSLAVQAESLLFVVLRQGAFPIVEYLQLELALVPSRRFLQNVKKPASCDNLIHSLVALQAVVPAPF